MSVVSLLFMLNRYALILENILHLVKPVLLGSSEDGVEERVSSLPYYSQHKKLIALSRRW